MKCLTYAAVGWLKRSGHFERILDSFDALEAAALGLGGLAGRVGL